MADTDIVEEVIPFDPSTGLTKGCQDGRFYALIPSATEAGIAYALVQGGTKTALESAGDFWQVRQGFSPGHFNIRIPTQETTRAAFILISLGYRKGQLVNFQ